VTGVSGATFILKNPAGTTIPAAVSYNATTRVATLNPSADLAANTTYTATLTGGTAAIRDTLGPPLASTSWSFTTTAAPAVTARTPGANATSVAVANNITATFNKAVTGVSGTTFVLKNPAGATITAAVSYDATTRVATLNPSANLAANTRYTATLTGGTAAIRDTPGTPLASTSWSFTTGAAPAVTARTPGSGATVVATGGNITATFSEAVTGVSGTTFVLKNPAGATITAAVS
ncbi:Ig-like domain-containing protein, partial [Arthrobacter mobilis]|uniref:Ig-like domain-containing protein n=1 Tax=Arthrobacter mobilis TaxID=2724944 RepID=UPI001FE45E76